MRKINVLKKLIAFLLVMVCITNVQCVNVNAVEKKEDRLGAYVENILPQYLSANGLLADEYKVSKPIALYNWETGESEKTFFLVFEGDNVVGQMVVQCYEGEYYSSFNTSYVDVLTRVYREKTPVAFGSYNECFVMRTATENVLLSVTNKVAPLKGLSDNAQVRTSHLNCLDTITVNSSREICPAAAPRATVFYKELGVNPVANATINCKGACWAACIASKVNYHNGTNLSAIDVNNRLICVYNGTPIGSDLWVERAYPLYNVNITRVDGTISGGVCFTQLNNEKPIHIHVYDGAVGHAILIIGVNFTYENNEGGVYRIMDPNLPEITSVAVSPSVIQNGSGFIYATGSYTYTNWVRTWY